MKAPLRVPTRTRTLDIAFSFFDDVDDSKGEVANHCHARWSSCSSSLSWHGLTFLPFGTLAERRRRVIILGRRWSGCHGCILSAHRHVERATRGSTPLEISLRL